MKKRTLTSGAMLAALLFASANTTFAQTVTGTSTASRVNTSRMHRMHWALSDSALAELATKLGLNPEQIANEIKSGKTIQQVLKDHGVTEDQIKTAFGSMKPKDLKNFKMTDAQITALASKLNLNVDEIKQQIAAGKTIKEILDAHGIKPADMQKIFGNKKLGKMNGRLFSKAMPEMLQAEAEVLGLSVDTLKQDIQNGQSPEQLARAKGMTTATYKTNVAQELQTMITNGTITGKKVNFYTTIIKKLTS